MSPREAFRGALRWRDLPALLVRHPALRDAITHRVFWDPSHERFLAMLAGSALALRLRSPLLGAVVIAVWGERRVNWREPAPARFAAQVALLPLWAAIDAVEIAGRLPSAVRHRVLVI
jgi:hypothetical protein